MAEFFNMGGYAGYVWPAYVSSFVVLGAIAFMILHRRRRLQKKLDRLAAVQKADKTNR